MHVRFLSIKVVSLTLWLYGSHTSIIICGRDVPTPIEFKEQPSLLLQFEILEKLGTLKANMIYFDQLLLGLSYTVISYHDNSVFI